MKVNFDEVLEVVKNNNGKLIILNGTKCIGKTTTSIKLGEYLSYNMKTPTLFYSLDIRKEDVEKVIINKSNNLIIDDTPNISINNISTNIETLYNKNNIELVIIDVIQLVTYKNFDNLSFDIQRQKIIEELVKISKKLNITIFITNLIHLPKGKEEYYNIKILE